MKTEKTQIHFLSDVFVAVASLDLKVPIGPSRSIKHGELKEIPSLTCQKKLSSFFTT